MSHFLRGLGVINVQTTRCSSPRSCRKEVVEDRTKEVIIMEDNKNLNGIQVDKLFDMIESIKRNPNLAQFRFRATNRWVDGTHNQARIDGFYGAGREHKSREEPLVLDEDEPPVLLGKNLGANPVEFVLTALSGCLTTSLIAQAAVRGIRLRKVESRLEGDLDVRGFLGMSEEVRNGYRNIRVTFKIKGDASQEELRELLELARKRSPVFDIVSHPVPVSVELEA